MYYPQQGLPERAAACQDDEGADRDEHGAGGQFSRQSCRDGCSDNAACDQPGDVEEGYAAQQDKKGNGAGQYDKEFRQAYGSDDITRILPLRDQGAGHQGPPTAAGEGIHESARRGQPPRPAHFGACLSAGESFPQDIVPQVDRVDRQRHPDIIRILVPEISETRAKDRANDPRDHDRAEQFLVDIAKAVMTVAGYAARKDACGVNAAADDGRTYPAIGQKEGGRNGPISQSHRTVHQLREKPRECHDAKGLDVEFAAQAAQEAGDATERKEGKYRVPDDHENECEQAPFDDPLPFPAAGAGEEDLFFLFCSPNGIRVGLSRRQEVGRRGRQNAGQGVERSYFLGEIAVEPRTNGLHVIEHTIHFLRDHITDLFLQTLRHGWRFAVRRNCDLQIAPANNRTQVEVAKVWRVGYINEYPPGTGFPGDVLADRPVVDRYDGEVRIFQVVRFPALFQQSEAGMGGCKVANGLNDVRGYQCDRRGRRILKDGLQFFETDLSAPHDQQFQGFQFHKQREQVVAAFRRIYDLVFFHY